MIDTIILTIPKEKFEITEPQKFEPNADTLFKDYFTPPFMKCVQNATKEDIVNLFYKPKLTLIKRRGHIGFSISLKVEFSIPKLVFGNNFEEIDDEDVKKIIPALHDRLSRMGIAIEKPDLAEADVQTVHFGKNIVFKDHTTVSSILQPLSKIKLTRKLDMGKTDYINDGEAVRYHSKSFQVVFYDKVEDLKKSKDRAMEKNDREHNPQYDIFEIIQRKVNPLEVLRIEVRLIGRAKIKQHFKRLGIDVPFTFKGIFQRSICRTVLLDYWESIEAELRPVLLQDLSFVDKFELIARQKSEYRPQRVLSMLSVAQLIKDDGYRFTRKKFDKYYTKETFDRIYKDLNRLNFKIVNKIKPIEKITQDIQECLSLKKKDFNFDSICVN